MASQVLEFLCRRGSHCSHMNTWRCDIAQSTLTFSSACDTQLHCQLHRLVRAPHAPGDSSIHTLLLCIPELAIWAASCHIKNHFPLEIGMSNLLFHHLHLHLYLYLYPYLLLCLHQNLSPNKNQNLHIGLGVNVTFQDIQCCCKLPHLVHEIIAFTAVEMGMHDQVVSCHPLFGFTSNQPCENAATGTRRRLKDNATNTHDIGSSRRKDCL